MTMTRRSDKGSIICAPQGEDSDARTVTGEERRESDLEVFVASAQRRREKQ
jgi:hypothetical protein